MQIGGLQKLSLIDFPGKVSAVIFTQGCNMFCPYCHNPQLVYKDLFNGSVQESGILAFLHKRRNILQGVVITGGEPTMQKDLKEFILKIKSFGFAVKLDTNGTNPKLLLELINENLLDFFAMDIKAPFDKYNVFYRGSADDIKQSAEIIKNSKIPHMFRTTFDEELINRNDLEEIKQAVYPSQYVVQECRK